MKFAQVTENEIAKLPAIPYTSTWHPVAHVDVIRQLNKQVEADSVVERRYQLSRDGRDLFATWVIDADKDREMLGFRNSTKKRFSLGFCAGKWVIVCSNMSFTGSFVEHRKHTSGLDEEELFMFVNRTLGTLRTHQLNYNRFMDFLQQVPITDEQFKLLTYEFMETDILPPSMFSRYLECRKEERKNHDTETETLRTVHNVVTRSLRDESINTIQARTARLNASMGWNQFPDFGEPTPKLWRVK